jgi:hypothetical protein
LVQRHFADRVAVERGALREKAAGEGIRQTLRSISFPPFAERV